MESNKLLVYFGEIVLPKPYFSPDGERGGVNPFYVGDPGCFYILVIKSGDGGAERVDPAYPVSNSFISLDISFSVFEWLIHFRKSWSI